MNAMSEISVDQLCLVVGEEGIAQLTAAFYRQIPLDPILGPLYPPDDLAGAEQRLRDFLIGRFGGSDRYLTLRGHPRLRMRHAPFTVNLAARNHWVELMTNAIQEMHWSPEIAGSLQRFLEQTATFLINAAE